MPAEST